MFVNPSIVKKIFSLCGCQDHPSDKRWKEGTHDMLCENPNYFVTTGPNLRVFTDMIKLAKAYFLHFSSFFPELGIRLYRWTGLPVLPVLFFPPNTRFKKKGAYRTHRFSVISVIPAKYRLLFSVISVIPAKYQLLFSVIPAKYRLLFSVIPVIPVHRL